MKDKRIVVTYAQSTDVKRMIKDLFEREKYKDVSYESRNKSDRKRDRKNRWR